MSLYKLYNGCMPNPVPSTLITAYQSICRVASTLRPVLDPGPSLGFCSVVFHDTEHIIHFHRQYPQTFAMLLDRTAEVFFAVVHIWNISERIISQFKVEMKKRFSDIVLIYKIFKKSNKCHQLDEKIEFLLKGVIYE